MTPPREPPTMFYEERSNCFYPSVSEALEQFEAGEKVCLEPFQAQPSRYFRITEDGHEEIEGPKP